MFAHVSATEIFPCSVKIGQYMSQISFTLLSVRFLLHRFFAELVVAAVIGDILNRLSPKSVKK
jgi:hypothetical protein